MKRERLDQYDTRPSAMVNYLSHYGWHFSKNMCEFALKHLPKKVAVLDRDKIDSLLKTYGITLENNQLYDYVYVTNYCLSVQFGSAIPDDKHLAHFVKNEIDLNEDGMIFTKWYASMCKLGIPIDWKDML